MAVTLTFLDFMPVKFGTDFNNPDPCNAVFSKRYCQPVQNGDETVFQVSVSQTGPTQIPAQADWSVGGSNWTANADGSITHSPGATTQALLSGFVTAGRLYKVSFTMSERTAGSVQFVLSSLFSHPYSENQTEVYFVSQSRSMCVTMVT